MLPFSANLSQVQMLAFQRLVPRRRVALQGGPGKMSSSKVVLVLCTFSVVE